MPREITTHRRIVVADRSESQEITISPEDFDAMKLPAIQIDMPHVASEIAQSFSDMITQVVKGGIPYGVSSDISAELARQDPDGGATKITIVIKTGPRTV
jgi:hypothetical protein